MRAVGGALHSYARGVAPVAIEQGMFTAAYRDQGARIAAGPSTIDRLAQRLPSLP